MKKDYLVLGGTQYRVEINWNALSSFLVAVGRDTLEGLSNIATFRPSDLTALIAAAVNEGERLEGRESALTALEVGAVLTPEEVGEFLEIYIRQSSPAHEVEEVKKKQEPEME